MSWCKEGKMKGNNLSCHVRKNYYYFTWLIVTELIVKKNYYVLFQW
jgi:hypothetical protein